MERPERISADVYFEEKIGLIELDRAYLQQVLGPLDTNSLLAVFMTKPAILEYTKIEERAYLPNAFVALLNDKVDCFATLGDIFIAAVVSCYFFLSNEKCTAKSMTQARNLLTSNTRWERLMIYYKLHKYVIVWPPEAPVLPHLRHILESLCCVVMMKTHSIVDAASLIYRLVDPVDFPPQEHGSSHIYLHDCLAALSVNAMLEYRTISEELVNSRKVYTEQLFLNGVALFEGTSELKETAQEHAAEQFVRSGGLADFVESRHAYLRATTSTRDFGLLERERTDVHPPLLRFFQCTHSELSALLKTEQVHLTETFEEYKHSQVGKALVPYSKNETGRQFSFIIWQKELIALYVDVSVKDSKSGCLHSLYDMLKVGLSCFDIYNHDTILQDPNINIRIKQLGGLSRLSPHYWMSVDVSVFNLY